MDVFALVLLRRFRLTFFRSSPEIANMALTELMACIIIHL